MKQALLHTQALFKAEYPTEKPKPVVSEEGYALIAADRKRQGRACSRDEFHIIDVDTLWPKQYPDSDANGKNTLKDVNEATN